MALATACRQASVPPSADAESVAPEPAEASPPPPITPVVLEPRTLVPAGEGFKCVYERCARVCTYPRTARTPTGSPPLPPCVERRTAFCYATEASQPNPPYALCFATRDACERERAQAAASSFAASGCEEL
ncbi:MAG: hypothetical protein HS104_33155 [Polyangiaceae bacterium]|nr:hypothetical protein [Polyangiaceae bacterium]MCL4755027.1 hypothetical protein [Myxococcales bacterium]